MEVLRDRVKQLDQHIELKLQEHEVGKLLTTKDGVGARTAACLIAELGDPSRFRDAAALASYVCAVPVCGTQASARFRALGACRLETRACGIDFGRRH